MKKARVEDIREHPELFYKTRDGDIYPFYKEEILNQVDVYRPDTFLSILEDLDYPFFEREWLRLIERQIEHQRPIAAKPIFGKYIALMNLRGFKSFRFNDSQYTKCFACQPEVSWTFIDEKHLDSHREPPPYNYRVMSYHNHRYSFWDIEIK